MRVLCLGGGPAGLYFAISMKLRDPSHEVVVLERNRANDTFGWGVVLSDDALGRMQKNDPVSTEAIRSQFSYWDDIATVHNGVRNVSGGHGFAGIGRKDTVITAGAGFNAAVSETLRLFASYQGEFGGGTGSQANLGITIAF